METDIKPGYVLGNPPDTMGVYTRRTRLVGSRCFPTDAAGVLILSAFTSPPMNP